MISVIDIAQLQPLLRDFYTITGIRITVFDQSFQELTAWPADLPEHCRLIRACGPGRTACVRCDREACRRAAETRETIVYRCHAGFTEAVTPLTAQGALVGYLILGNVFSYDSREEGLRAISAACTALPVSREELLSACARQKLITREYVRSAAQIMLTVASHVILERIATLREDHVASQVDQYLAAHYQEDLSVADICRATGIGKSQLYAVSRQLYSRGVASHLRDLRISKAKELLSEQSDLSLADIADLCGFSDYNYFISVFTRMVGISPGAWRRNRQERP